MTGLLAVVAGAAAGDVIYLLDGTHTLGASTLNIDKQLTILGQSEAGTIIDASGIDGYGILVTADDSSLSNFTLNGPAAGGASGNYGIKAQPDTGVATDRLDGLTIDHVTVSNSGRSEIDLNGVVNATLSNITVDGNGTAGVGVAITDSAHITLNNVTTVDNAWGSVALYSSNTFYDQQTTDITFTGTFSYNESIGIYAEDPSATQSLGTLVLPPSFTGDGDGAWTVTNDAYRGAGSANFTFYFADAASASAFALALQQAPSVVNTRSVITGPDGSLAVMPGMSLQAAIDAAEAGDTISVAAGTFTETINVNKQV